MYLSVCRRSWSMLYTATLFTLPLRLSLCRSGRAPLALGDCGRAAGVASAICRAASTAAFVARANAVRAAKHSERKTIFFIMDREERGYPKRRVYNRPDRTGKSGSKVSTAPQMIARSGLRAKPIRVEVRKVKPPQTRSLPDTRTSGRNTPAAASRPPPTPSGTTMIIPCRRPRQQHAVSVLQILLPLRLLHPVHLSPTNEYVSQPSPANRKSASHATHIQSSSESWTKKLPSCRRRGAGGSATPGWWECRP